MIFLGLHQFKIANPKDGVLHVFRGARIVVLVDSHQWVACFPMVDDNPAHFAEASITILWKGLSLRWKQEIVHLPPPYVALGFDQYNGRTPRTMGELQSIKHLSQYAVVGGHWDILTFQRCKYEVSRR